MSVMARKTEEGATYESLVRIQLGFTQVLEALESLQQHKSYRVQRWIVLQKFEPLKFEEQRARETRTGHGHEVNVESMSRLSHAGQFRHRHFPDDVIVQALRWYLRYSLSYRDLKELLAERGVIVDHTTIWRWVNRYGPELDERMRRTCFRLAFSGASTKPTSASAANGCISIEPWTRWARPSISSFRRNAMFTPRSCF